MEGIIETIQSVDTLGVGLTGSLVAAAFLNSLYMRAFVSEKLRAYQRKL